MRHKIKNFLFRFFTAFTMYIGIEMLWDNSSDRKMGWLGGLSFTIGHLLPKKWSMRKRSFCMAIIILVLEYIGGKLWNSDYKIWDYRNIKIGKIPLHIDGQVSIPFAILWFLLAPFIFWMNDKLDDETIDVLDYYKELTGK